MRDLAIVFYVRSYRVLFLVITYQLQSLYYFKSNLFQDFIFSILIIDFITHFIFYVVMFITSFKYHFLKAQLSETLRYIVEQFYQHHYCVHGGVKL